jgi:multidrug resistance efflux pump
MYRSVPKAIALLVWLLAAGAAYWLHREWAGGGQASGVAEVKEFTISTVETGRLTSVEVVCGQRVWRGQVVARLDTSILEGEIAVAEAELRELEAKVPAEHKTLELGGLETERAFHRELEEAEIELRAARSSCARDRAELASVREELGRQQDLVGRRLTEATRMKDLEVRLAGLEQATAAWPARTEALEKRVQAARARLTGWLASQAGASRGNGRREQLRPLQLRILRQREYLRLLEKRLDQMELRAPADARVATIVARQGKVLTPGDPVMVMVEAEPRQVIAYVEEERGSAIAAGGKAVIRRRDRRAGRVEGTVVAVAGTVSEVPSRFWPAPNRPRWGREVFISIDPGQSLDPGEAVDITFPGSAGGPAPLVVPARLRAMGRLEPSGLIWLEALQRYLVVSDDTGWESAHDNAPWLFTLARNGVLDAEPVLMEGVQSVNDLEAITASPDGTIYLMASQSRNRAGRRRPPRTVFVQARLYGKTLRAVGQVSFHNLVARAALRDAAFLTSLGLDAPVFEIEGLAWHDGALFLGLKEPLDGAGGALIWKLQHPDRLFRGDLLAAAGLTLWSKASLRVEGRPAGISELLFLPDGALLLAATNAAGGALFRARAPGGGDLPAETVMEYPLLKPEGLCLTPEGSRVVVVFDRQQETPLWSHLEMPR